MKHSIFILLALLFFSSCVFNDVKKERCRLVKATVIQDVQTKGEAKADDGYVSFFDTKYVIVDSISFEHDYVYPKVNICKGEPIWLVSDWKGALFLSSVEDITLAAEGYIIDDLCKQLGNLLGLAIVLFLIMILPFLGKDRKRTRNVMLIIYLITLLSLTISLGIVVL